MIYRYTDRYVYLTIMLRKAD